MTKKTTKILLLTLGFGLLAATIGFPTVRPTPAKTPPPPPPRPMPVVVTNPPLEPLLASDTLTLIASSRFSPSCGNPAVEMFAFDQVVIKNSGVTQPFTLPAGKVLVVTGFDWLATGSPAVANQLRTAFLNPATSAGFNAAEAESTALADSTGKAGGSETFPTGIVLQNPARFCLQMYPAVTGEVASGVINGFLAPDK